MQTQKVIEQLGYTANEAKVYLATLSLGEAHVSDIAKKLKLPRTSVQTILDRLNKDGLVNFYVQRRYKYWVAENPERLLINLKKRHEAVEEAIPALSALRKSHWGKPRTTNHVEKDIGFFRILADDSPQPLLITNNETFIVHVNPAWEKQFGYSKEEVVGQNPRFLQSNKTPRDVYTEMWECLRAGKLFQSDRIIDKRKDGTLFTLLTTVFPIHHSGRVYYVQILDDLDARDRVEALHKSFILEVED